MLHPLSHSCVLHCTVDPGAVQGLLIGYYRGFELGLFIPTRRIRFFCIRYSHKVAGLINWADSSITVVRIGMSFPHVNI